MPETGCGPKQFYHLRRYKTWLEGAQIPLGPLPPEKGDGYRKEQGWAHLYNERHSFSIADQVGNIRWVTRRGGPGSSTVSTFANRSTPPRLQQGTTDFC